MKFKPQAKFICAECGRGEYSLATVIYACKECGGLLEVAQDLEKLKEKSGGQWRNLFDQRLAYLQHPYTSGVWDKKEFILPHIDDDKIISLGEGRSPLLAYPRLAAELSLNNIFVKQWGTTHTGSFKDLGMTVLLSQVNHMLKSGQNIKAVACASTGDTSAALAAYAAYAGIPAIVFLPADKISLAQLIQPVAQGALVISLDTDFDGCMRLVQEVTQNQNIYLANSINSLRVEGQKTVSYEIAQQLGWEVPEHIIIPGGNLGNVSALGKGFLEMKELGLISRLPHIIVAQAKNANPLYQWYDKQLEKVEPVKAQKTLASAIQIGNPVSAKKAVKVLREVGGRVEQAAEAELAEAAAWGDRFGLYNCPHTGVALAALIKLVKRQIISPKERVVIVSTAHGLKFSQFKMDYHQGKLAGENKYQNPPLLLPNEVDKVIAVLADKLSNR